MVQYTYRKEGITMNFGGLNLINFLNVMAKHSQYDFKPFSEIIDDSNIQGIIYDDSKPKTRSSNQTIYPVVSEYSLNGNEPIIIGTLEASLKEYGLLVYVVKDENDKFWLELSSEDNIPPKIIIEKGRWYCDV